MYRLHVLLLWISAVRADPFSPGSAAPDNAKQQVVDLLTAIFTGAPNASLNSVNDHKYIQHNVVAQDNKPALVALVQWAMKNPSVPPKFLRVFQDNDIVFVHSENPPPGPTVGFDVFRFEDGQIVEHWDNFQNEVPKNGAGHTMIDGPTQATDLDKTAANKALVKGFVTEVLVNGKSDSGPGYFGSQFIEHNPSATADGYAASVALIGLFPVGSNICTRIRHLMGEGNFVLSMCDGTIGTNASAFYNLYRVENGKIVEHWDVVDQTAPVSTWKSFNGKF